MTTTTRLIVSCPISRSAGIRAGEIYPDRADLTVDLAQLTNAEREYVAEHMADGRCAATLPAPTDAALLTHIQQEVERRTAKIEKVRTESIAAAEHALTLPLTDWILTDRCGWAELQLPDIYLRDKAVYLAVPGVAERIAEVGQEVTRLNAVRRAMREQEQRDTAERERLADEAQAQAVERLKAWALEHGSELVRERIASGFKWISLAEDEFFTAHCPEGFGATMEVDNFSERTAPTLQEIRALQALRAQIADYPIYTDPQLLWNTVDASTDEETGETIEGEKFCSLCVQIQLPSGKLRAAERKL